MRFLRDEEGDLMPIDAVARGPSAAEVAYAIRSGVCPDDRFFDRFLPHDLRVVSGQHWTPLLVAQRVAEWLEAAGIETVVDVGSGAGKLCVAAALASRCRFTGVEQRSRLVDAARALASQFGVEDRVGFVHATLRPDTLPVADAYYLYNPFGENVFGPESHLDDEVELGAQRYERDVALMEEFFNRAPVGTYVIKYNGFGGRMPPSYQPLLVDRTMPNVLRMWRKEQGNLAIAVGGPGR